MGGRGQFFKRTFGRSYMTAGSSALAEPAELLVEGVGVGVGVVAPRADPLAIPSESARSAADFSSDYTVIDQQTALGGAVYPFLDQTGRAWRIIKNSVKEPTVYPNAHTFGMDKPTLRYVNGGKVE